MAAGGIPKLAGVPLALQCHPMHIRSAAYAPGLHNPPVLQQIQAAVLPHVAVQRLGSALGHVLPFLGFYVHWPGWQGAMRVERSPAALVGHMHPDRAGAHVGLLYIDMGADPLQYLRRAVPLNAGQQTRLHAAVRSELHASAFQSH